MKKIILFLACSGAMFAGNKFSLNKSRKFSLSELKIPNESNINLQIDLLNVIQRYINQHQSNNPVKNQDVQERLWKKMLGVVLFRNVFLPQRQKINLENEWDIVEFQYDPFDKNSDQFCQEVDFALAGYILNQEAFSELQVWIDEKYKNCLTTKLSPSKFVVYHEAQ